MFREGGAWLGCARHNEYFEVKKIHKNIIEIRIYIKLYSPNPKIYGFIRYANQNSVIVSRKNTN